MIQDTPIESYIANWPPTCACGCGEQVKWNVRNRCWNKYIRFHYATTNSNKEVFRNYNLSRKGKLQSEESNLKRSQTMKGQVRWNRGLTKETDERIAKMANSKKGRKIDSSKKPKISQGVRKAASDRLIRLNKSEQRREQERKRMLGLGEKHLFKSRKFREKVSKNVTQRMLNGQAAYMNSCIKNPSLPQTELFEKVQRLFSQAILNYPSLNKSIDIAIPDQMIAIEYDGSYWHQDKEADLIRQEELEAVGWKFLRYVDYIPNMKVLREDLQRLSRNDLNY